MAGAAKSQHHTDLEQLRLKTQEEKELQHASVFSPTGRALRHETEFQTLSVLGRGAFGEVFKARNLVDGQPYAIKRVRLSFDPELQRRVLREASLLSSLNHQNVIRYFNAWVEGGEEVWGSSPSGDVSGSRLGRQVNSRHALQQGQSSHPRAIPSKGKSVATSTRDDVSGDDSILWGRGRDLDSPGVGTAGWRGSGNGSGSGDGGQSSALAARATRAALLQRLSGSLGTNQGGHVHTQLDPLSDDEYVFGGDLSELPSSLPKSSAKRLSSLSAVRTSLSTASASASSRTSGSGSDTTTTVSIHRPVSKLLPQPVWGWTGPSTDSGITGVAPALVSGFDFPVRTAPHVSGSTPPEETSTTQNTSASTELWAEEPLIQCKVCQRKYVDWEINMEEWNLLDVSLQPYNLCEECYLMTLRNMGMNTDMVRIRRKIRRPLYLFVQMELCQHSLLEEMVQPQNGVPERWALFTQICQGLSYLHSKNIAHRDLKPGNIFCMRSSGGNVQCKIGDLGLATVLPHRGANMTTHTSLTAAGEDLRDSEHKTHSAPNGNTTEPNKPALLTGGVGTIFYTAPEVLKAEDACQQGSAGGPMHDTVYLYDHRCDLYSLGVLLFELFHTWRCTTSMERHMILQDVRRGVLPKEFEVRFPFQTRLVVALTDASPSLRPSAEHVLSLIQKSRSPLHAQVAGLDLWSEARSAGLGRGSSSSPSSSSSNAMATVYVPQQQANSTGTALVRLDATPVAARSSSPQVMLTSTHEVTSLKLQVGSLQERVKWLEKQLSSALRALDAYRQNTLGSSEPV